MRTREQAIAEGLSCAGFLDAPQMGFLYDLAVQAPDGVVAEIGVYEGRSLLCWAAAREGRGPLVAIDTWAYGDHKAPFEANLIRLGYEARVLAMRGDEAAAHVADGVAMLFVDGDHGLGGVDRDLAAWASKIMPGGVLAFHDYAVWKPTVIVKQVVDEWQAKAAWEPLDFVGSTIAYRRPIASTTPG